MAITDYPIHLLNKKELLYWRMIYPRSGVLYLMSEPGLAKSAMLRAIATKLGLQYIDLRLSYLDETDVGLYPDKKPIKYSIVKPDGTKESREENFLTHIVPYWAHIANKKPTLIHFEELNRAPLPVRNAALQILLEKEVGYNFKFNKTVYMVSSGNLGEEDNTDVEEFDSALSTRLLPYAHRLNYDEWYEYFAKDNVHEVINMFLKDNPEHYLMDQKKRKDSKTYSNPRTWTHLSMSIEENFGKDADVPDFISFVEECGSSYVGLFSNGAFVKWCKDYQKLTIRDIIEDYNSVKRRHTKMFEGQKILDLTRDKKSQLLMSLKSFDLSKIDGSGLENIKSFLLDIGKDEVCAYMIDLLDRAKDEEIKNITKNVFKDQRFSAYVTTIRESMNHYHEKFVKKEEELEN